MYEAQSDLLELNDIFSEMLDLFSELRRIKDICHIKPPEVPQSDRLTVEDSALLPQPP